MTNRETIQNMETKEFCKKINEVLKNPFSAYINYEEYFDGDDPEINHYIKHEYEATLLPAEAELINADTENSITSPDGTLDKEKYMKEHSRKVLVLNSKDTYYYGVQYATVADILFNRILKVPLNALIAN